MKDPYLLQQKHKLNKVPNDGIDDILKKLKELNEKDVYEIGMEFCQNMIFLKDNGIDISGGVEFDPTFYQYANKFYKVSERDFKLSYTYISYWKPEFHNVYFTNNFLSLFQNTDYVLNILKQNCNILVTNENGEITVYVNDNSEKINDSKSDTVNNEVSDDQSLENGLDKTGTVKEKFEE